uniref:Uncharacterized protein n=1 Tax=Tetraselmis sp. GSL018 TaxID=582737 RepID=A0A061QNN4_9CHLO
MRRRLVICRARTVLRAWQVSIKASAGNAQQQWQGSAGQENVPASSLRSTQPYPGLWVEVRQGK